MTLNVSYSNSYYKIACIIIVHRNCWTCSEEVASDCGPRHCQVTTLGKLFTHSHSHTRAFVIKRYITDQRLSSSLVLTFTDRDVTGVSSPFPLWLWVMCSQSLPLWQPTVHLWRWHSIYGTHHKRLSRQQVWRWSCNSTHRFWFCQRVAMPSSLHLIKKHQRCSRISEWLTSDPWVTGQSFWPAWVGHDWRSRTFNLTTSHFQDGCHHAMTSLHAKSAATRWVNMSAGPYAAASVSSWSFFLFFSVIPLYGTINSFIIVNVI